MNTTNQFFNFLWKIGFLFAVALLPFCQEGPFPGSSDAYSFFVAGHTYGNFKANNSHLHPPFLKQWTNIKTHPNIAFGILAGDVVRYGSVENWNAVDEDIAELGFPVYIAPGNHDMTDAPLLESRHGDPDNGNRTFRWFKFQNDLFIVLNSELDEWNISGGQLDFLKTTLEEQAPASRNIFVMVHSLIFWDDENIFKNIHTNWWPPYIPDTTNYWTDVEPLLRRTAKPVYLFAGDLGANKQATPYLYYKDGSIAYIGTGMGNLKDDNFVFVNVDPAGEVSFELIALQGDPQRFGKLEDYDLP